MVTLRVIFKLKYNYEKEDIINLSNIFLYKFDIYNLFINSNVL